MEIKDGQLQLIGNTIRAVAKAQAERYFKLERAEDQQYAALVWLAIEAQIAVALYDAGISFTQIIDEIDTTEYVEAAMVAAGFVLD